MWDVGELARLALGLFLASFLLRRHRQLVRPLLRLVRRG